MCERILPPDRNPILRHNNRSLKELPGYCSAAHWLALAYEAPYLLAFHLHVEAVS